MKYFLITIFLVFSGLMFSCIKDDKPVMVDPPINNTPVKKLEGTWQYSHMDIEIYDSTEKFESKYNQNLTGQTLELKEDKSFQFQNPTKPETNKTGNWLTIDSTKLILGNDTFKIQQFTASRLVYKSGFINYTEKPGHLGPTDKPVPKKRIEIFYLNK